MKAYIDAVAKKLQQFEFLTYGLIITPLPPQKNRKVREKSSKQASKQAKVCAYMRESYHAYTCVRAHHTNAL